MKGRASMGFLSESDRRELQERFQELPNPVNIIFFTQELECPYCRQTGLLLQEVADLSEKVHLEVYNFQLDREKAAEYAIDKVPATVVAAEKDYGIRFYGVPAGYEFLSFIEAILHVSRGESGLAPRTVEALRGIASPVHLQVFATPT